MLEDYAAVVEKHAAFVAEGPDGMVGVLVLIATPSGILLDNVAVHPALQGKGIGHRLLAFAEAEACRRGYDCIELYTHECMTENIELYRRIGYRETDRRSEQGYDRVYMKKHLRVL